jgi:hypothetical protein
MRSRTKTALPKLCRNCRGDQRTSPKKTRKLQSYKHKPLSRFFGVFACPFVPNERSGMRWITREKIKVDRVACPWLIRNFVDSEAEFVPRETEWEKIDNGTVFDVSEL